MDNNTTKKVVMEIKNVDKKYGNKYLFQNFNLQVYENEMVCIAGASGSGKSTLLNMIGMFEFPDAGEIRLFNQKQPKVESKAGRKLMHDKILYLFQNYALVDNESVDYNLEIPMIDNKLSKQKKKELKLEALRKVGLSTPLKEKIFHLSGGEQQRIAIARGYLKQFDLLLADEPTGSLDEKNRDEILKLLTNFQKAGKTIIIVSHDPVVMNYCDRIVRIS